MGGNIVLTDDNQNVLVRYEYDVFGAIRNETGTSDNTRKFTGKEFDADSNLYYYGARYYDPYIGRFTQRDPIGDGVNWYAYTYNNPLKFVDPTGTTIVFLGTPDAHGNSNIEFTASANGKDFHGGSIDTLSTGPLTFYRAIYGIGNTNPTHGGVEHPSLADTNVFGQTITDLINSDTTIYLIFDSSLDVGTGGLADFMGPSNDKFLVRINGQHATGDYPGLIGTRHALVHELTHASQAIADPAGFRNRDYYSVFEFERQAYDTGAKFAAELQGDYIKTLDYMPEYLLHGKRFNPQSYIYKAHIHMAARAAANRFR